MRMFSTVAFMIVCAAGVGASPAQPAGADAGACHYTPEGLQSWKDLWARQLRVLDPSHAAQLTKATAEIIDGQKDALKSDIASGLSPNATLKGPGGDMSLLELAVAACQAEVARELVLLGASADGDSSSTPLVVAAAKGEADLAEFLIQHGASVERVDVNGHTALEDAVRQHQLGTVRTLLQHGGNANHTLARHATLLDLVANSPDGTDQAIVGELRAHGAVSGLANTTVVQ